MLVVLSQLIPSFSVSCTLEPSPPPFILTLTLTLTRHQHPHPQPNPNPIPNPNPSPNPNPNPIPIPNPTPTPTPEQTAKGAASRGWRVEALASGTGRDERGDLREQVCGSAPRCVSSRFQLEAKG